MTNWSWNASQTLVTIRTKRVGIVKWRMSPTIQFYKNQVPRHWSHWKEFVKGIQGKYQDETALGERDGTDPQVVRGFQKKILWTQFLASSFIYKSTETVNIDICSPRLAKTFSKDECLIAQTPFPKITYVLAWSYFLELFERLSPGYAPQ